MASIDIKIFVLDDKTAWKDNREREGSRVTNRDDTNANNNNPSDKVGLEI